MGLDYVPAEALKNKSSIDMLLKISIYCFENISCPDVWKQSIIYPIKKCDTDHRGVSLLSIPCKIYSDILNSRFSKWLEGEDILAKEQNGFRF